MVVPHFNNIRQAILDSLDIATEEILVAVYWFANTELFLKLCDKLEKGIKVDLIIHNDYINNRATGLDFQRFVFLGGNFYFSNADNPMHNKFCVIDNKILINGSYNWTYYAEKNNYENILIINKEESTITAFRNEFQSIKRQLKKVEKIERLTRFELDEFNGLSANEYLANDIIYQAKETGKREIVETAFQISPNNIKVQATAVALNLSPKRKLKSSIGASLEGDKYLIGIEKGTIIPITISKITRTVSEDQPSGTTTISFGESKLASQNTKLKSVTVKGIPPKPKGEAILKILFTIDLYGKMYLKIYSLDNGNFDDGTVDINNLLENIDDTVL